jgi:flagellar protein FlbD
MIKLTRLNTEPLALDPDLIERLDATPDTVVTMVDGSKHMVTEGLSEVIERARQHRAALVAATRRIRTSAAPSEGEVVAMPRKAGRRR